MSNQQQEKQLPPNALQQADYMSTRHDAVVQNGVAPSDLLAPAFWAHHAVKLKPMDEIRARAEDGTWVAYLIVLDCSRTWAKVHQLSLYNLTSRDVSMTQTAEAEVKAFIEAHEVIHRGPRGWSIVRKSDRAVIEEGLGRDAATTKLDERARAQVGAPAAKKAEPVAT